MHGSELSHAVVATAVPIAPLSVRRKLISPAADAWSFTGTELSTSAVSPTKKKGIRVVQQFAVLGLSESRDVGRLQDEVDAAVDTFCRAWGTED